VREMAQFLKTLSLAPRSIKRKLTIAFLIMSVIPTLVFGYLISYYLLPTVKGAWQIYLVVAIVLTLMLLGFYLAKKIIYPIAEIAAHAKGIAEGRLEQRLDIEGEDEIGELSGSLNRLSRRLKENMGELHSYGEKIKQINMEINKKVFALSALLQIGNLITAACNLDEVFQLVVSKLSQMEPEGKAFLMLFEEDKGQLRMRAGANIEDEVREPIKIKGGQGSLGQVLASGRHLVIDTQKKRPKVIDKDLAAILRTKNIAVLPVTSSGKVIGILGIGNNIENFLFVDDEIELFGVFAKQAAVAIENDLLLRKTKELSVRDELTGLYNENYLRGRLDEEIKRAISYQRPCSFIIFEVDSFKRCRDLLGEIDTEKSLKKIAQILKESTTEIDKVARFSDHQFAVIFPEKNKSHAFNLAENIRKEIERFGLKQQRAQGRSFALTLSAGISATPIDGETSVELINKALYYTEKAKDAGANRVFPPS